MKWGKKKFEDLELSTEEPPLVFKVQLFGLTNVPPERQKVMLGGATIGDQEWGKAQAKIKDVSVIASFMGYRLLTVLGGIVNTCNWVQHA